jgi:hypothetical protein
MYIPEPLRFVLFIETEPCIALSTYVCDSYDYDYNNKTTTIYRSGNISIIKGELVYYIKKGGPPTFEPC